MKLSFTPTLLFIGALGSCPVPAHAQHPTPLVVAGRPSVRPLTRYLAATLHLTTAQAAAVQQALRATAPQPLAPEALTPYLGPLLPLEAQERLLILQNDVTSYRALYYLAARH